MGVNLSNVFPVLILLIANLRKRALLIYYFYTLLPDIGQYFDITQ
jgi:hypothetical protein